MLILSATLAALVQGCSAVRLAGEVVESGAAAKVGAAAIRGIGNDTGKLGDEFALGERWGNLNPGLRPEPLKLALPFPDDPPPPPQHFSLPEKGKIGDIPAKCFSTKKDTVVCSVVGWLGAKTADTTYECLAKPLVEDSLSTIVDVVHGVKERYEVERCAKGEIQPNSESNKGEVKISLIMPSNTLNPTRLGSSRVVQIAQTTQTNTLRHLKKSNSEATK